MCGGWGASVVRSLTDHTLAHPPADAEDGAGAAAVGAAVRDASHVGAKEGSCTMDCGGANKCLSSPGGPQRGAKTAMCACDVQGKAQVDGTVMTSFELKVEPRNKVDMEKYRGACAHPPLLVFKVLNLTDSAAGLAVIQKRRVDSAGAGIEPSTRMQKKDDHGRAPTDHQILPKPSDKKEAQKPPPEHRVRC